MPPIACSRSPCSWGVKQVGPVACALLDERVRALHVSRALKRAIFHLGIHRAGSTAIQRFLTFRRAELLEHATEAWTRTNLNAHAARRRLMLLPEARARPLGAMFALTACSADTLVISEENLLGTMPGLDGAAFYPGARRALVRLVLRRQDRLLESMYAFRVSRGASLSFSDFLALFRDTSLSYWPLVRELCASPIADVRIALFEDLFRAPSEWDVAAFLGIFRAPSWLSTPLSAANVSVRGPLLHALRYLNRYGLLLDKVGRRTLVTRLEPWSRGGVLPTAIELRQVVREVGFDVEPGVCEAALAFAVREPPAELSKAERRALLERLREDNERLLALRELVSDPETFRADG
jgi:hypothetical protein